MKEDLARQIYTVMRAHFGQGKPWRELPTEVKEQYISKFAAALSEIGPPPTGDPPGGPPRP